MITTFAAVAHAAATSDQAATADMVLDVAVKEAVDLIKHGQVSAGRERLHRAGASADRILGQGRGAACGAS